MHLLPKGGGAEALAVASSKESVESRGEQAPLVESQGLGLSHIPKTAHGDSGTIAHVGAWQR